MKYIFIVNPVSGKNKGLVSGKIIDEYCKSIGVNYELFYTDKEGSAETLASTYSKSEDTIIYSVGGDGTLNEVINGMVFSPSSLGIIPVGSGNDFYKNLDENDSKIIDIGKVNDKYFINIASLGLDAEIANCANDLKKYKVPSNMIYVISLLKNYFKFNGIKLNIDNKDKNLTILTICNGKCYGGGFKIAPNAILNDGLFDIYEVNNLNKLKTMKLLYKLLKGTHESDPNVISFKSDKITVNSSLPLTCNIDGEITSGSYFDFEIQPGAIRLDNRDNLKVIKLLKDKKIIK